MCRMLLANRSGISRLVKKLSEFPNCNTLADFLKGLDLRHGGHGCGVVLYGDGSVLHYEKGVDLQPERAAAVLEGRDYEWAVFHAREASVGSVSDENCHPFVIEGRHHMVLAANGSESAMAALGRVTGDRTDSEFIARMIVDMDLPFPRVLACFNSNFVGLYDGRPFAKKGDRQLLKFQAGRDIVFASDFPFGLAGITRPGHNYCWFEREESVLPG